MPETADRDEEMLARLAEFDLAAAERVHGRLMAAEAAGEIAELGRTYQRIARSLRQTLALKAKLKRDREAAAREAASSQAPPPRGPVARARRLRDLRQAVTRVIWDEAESPDHAADLTDTLDALLAEAVLDGRFCFEALDDHVARICLELDLSLDGAERWRDLPEAPDDEDPDAAPADAAPDRMSSA
ncbi:hypothetical protein [Phenylobacterium sp.]|jgi:hypothetical protein|uniref:hypothetical protein n=1 Tax=Phenylobacterium sp. TaxID=1871053 RepID=UPI002F415DCD